MDGLALPQTAERIGFRDHGRLTLADLAILIGAFAIVSAIQRPAGGYFRGASPLSADLVAWVASLLAHQIGVATAILMLMRRARFGSLPTAAEWVLILRLAVIPADYADGAFHGHLGTAVATGAAWKCTTPYVPGVNQGLAFEPAPTSARWSRVGAAFGIVAVGCVFLRAGRRRLSATAKVAIIAVLAMALRWGPMSVIRQAWRFPRPQLPHIGSWVWLGEAWLEQLGDSLLFTLPAAAALIGWRRRSQAEWLATLVAVLLVVGDEVLRLSFSSVSGPGAPGRLAYRSILLAQDLLTLALAALIAWQIGPTWNRWIGSDSSAPRMESAS